MADPSAAVQKAVYDALIAAGVCDGRVYDSPPDGPTFPYVTIGDGQTVDDSNSCFDGSEIFVQVDVWSRTSSFAEAKIAAGAVRDAIARPLTVTDFRNLIGEFVQSTPSRDPDGITRRVRSEFRYAIDHPLP